MKSELSTPVIILIHAMVRAMEEGAGRVPSWRRYWGRDPVKEIFLQNLAFWYILGSENLDICNSENCCSEQAVGRCLEALPVATVATLFIITS